MKRALLALVLLSLLRPPLGAQEGQGAEPPAPLARLARQMLQGLDALRREQGLAGLEPDPVLAATAAAYALVLGRRGELSHRDEAGASALQRYRAQGGTAVLVGELLGAGADAAAVIDAWRLSPPHRDVLLDARWTHAGAGVLPLGQGGQVWVVVFARRLVEELQLRPCPEGYCLEGRFGPRAEGVVEPFLLSGIRLLPPESWQAAEGRFRFVVPREQGSLYHRLGYRGADGEPRLTDAFVPVQLLTCAPETAPR